MDQFVVSARKYRPATFRSVVGQQHVTTTLKNAIATGRLAQAFLFCGPRGVGKTTCARILAKTINCLNLTAETEACGQCTACQSFQQNGSLNVYELDAASNNSVDDIRSLTEQVRYPPQTGRYKVYIIDEVHMLTVSAFNAFLKTLEEPPPYAIFILATTEKHKIIPTILSRCQIFDFNRIQVPDMAEHLTWVAEQENIVAEPEALRLIAQKADGGLRDALSTFDMVSMFADVGDDQRRQVTYAAVLDNLHVLDYDYFFRVTEAALNEDVPTALLLLDEVLRKGFDGHNFIVGLGGHLRDLLVCQDARTLPLLEVSEEVQARYAAQAATSSGSFLLTALNLISECDGRYKSSKNQRLLVELTLMKICHVRAAVVLAQEQAQAQPEKKSEVVRDQPPAYQNKVTPPASAPAEVAPPAPVAVPPPTDGQPPPARSNGSAPRGGMKRTPRIDSTFEPTVVPPAAPSPTTEADAAPAAVAPAVAVPLTEASLAARWEQVVAGLVAEQPSLSFLRRVCPTLAGSKLSLTLENDPMADAFAKAGRQTLLADLRAYFGRPALTLDVTVTPAAAPERKAYTPQERFRQWTEQNPALLDLKEKLGLEIDY